MGFCPFLSLRVKATLAAEILDEAGTVYTRNGAGVFVDDLGGTIGSGETPPAALASVWGVSGAEILRVIGADGVTYSKNANGIFLDALGKTPPENDTWPVVAETSAQAYGFFICQQNESCQQWDPINERCGLMDAASAPTKSQVPKAAVLINEYMGREDLDNNGAIYGIDFHIRPADLAPMLETIPAGGAEWTWQQYLDSL